MASGIVARYGPAASSAVMVDLTSVGPPDAVHRLSHVSSLELPVTTRDREPWKARNALRVFTPPRPSISPGENEERARATWRSASVGLAGIGAAGSAGGTGAAVTPAAALTGVSAASAGRADAKARNRAQRPKFDRNIF